MKIHKDGFGTILLIWGLCGVLIFLCLHFIPFSIISYPLSAVFIFVMCFVFFFFRVPERETAQGDRLVTSVADGEVVIVDRVYEGEYLKSECIQVSGKVTYYAYHPGKYFLAFLPKASELNEHTSIAIRSEYGEVFFKQIAGTFARRIVSYANVGEGGTKGEQCGIIKFGSRIDMYLPLGTDIKVKVGDEVRACETVIAELK